MPEMLVVAFSCDRYAAAWPALCHGFKKYWPDCPWPFVIVTNHLKAPCGETIKVGKDDSWSHTVLRGLKRIHSHTILLLFEDHWITAPPDTKALIDFARLIKAGHADHIRLKEGKLKCVGTFPLDSRLAILSPSERYRACLQPGFWHVPVLRSLLRPGETPWQFEQRSARRAKRNKRFLCVRSSTYFPYAIIPEWSRGIIKDGKWTDGARKYAEREGLKIDFSKNPKDV